MIFECLFVFFYLNDSVATGRESCSRIQVISDLCWLTMNIMPPTCEINISFEIPTDLANNKMPSVTIVGISPA